MSRLRVGCVSCNLADVLVGAAMLELVGAAMIELVGAAMLELVGAAMLELVGAAMLELVGAAMLEPNQHPPSARIQEEHLQPHDPGSTSGNL